MNIDTKEFIDKMPIREMLYKNRFSGVGDPLFKGDVGKYFFKVMSEKREAIGSEAWTALSKEIGWGS